MPGLQTVLDAGADHYSGRLDLTGYGHVPASPTLPALILVPTLAGYGRGYGPGVDDVWTVELWLLLARVEEQVDQARLLGYVDGTGHRSIRAATLQGQSSRGDAFGLRHCKARLLGVDSMGARFTGGGLSHLGAVLRLELTLPATDDELPTA